MLSIFRGIGVLLKIALQLIICTGMLLLTILFALVIIIGLVLLLSQTWFWLLVFVLMSISCILGIYDLLFKK